MTGKPGEPDPEQKKKGNKKQARTTTKAGSRATAGITPQTQFVEDSDATPSTDHWTLWGREVTGVGGTTANVVPGVWSLLLPTQPPSG